MKVTEIASICSLVCCIWNTFATLILWFCLSVAYTCGSSCLYYTYDLLIATCVEEEKTWSLFALLMLSETGSIQFVDERLIRKSVSLYDNINLNKLPLFSQRIEHKPSRAERTVTLMKGDYRFFANLYVACQLRAGDLENFFAHKSHGFPVSLCKYGKLTQVRIYRLSAKLERTSSRCSSHSCWWSCIGSLKLYREENKNVWCL